MPFTPLPPEVSKVMRSPMVAGIGGAVSAVVGGRVVVGRIVVDVGAVVDNTVLVAADDVAVGRDVVGRRVVFDDGATSAASKAVVAVRRGSVVVDTSESSAPFSPEAMSPTATERAPACSSGSGWVRPVPGVVDTGSTGCFDS